MKDKKIPGPYCSLQMSACLCEFGVSCSHCNLFSNEFRSLFENFQVFVIVVVIMVEKISFQFNISELIPEDDGNLGIRF